MICGAGSDTQMSVDLPPFYVLAQAMRIVSLDREGDRIETWFDMRPEDRRIFEIEGDAR